MRLDDALHEDDIPGADDQAPGDHSLADPHEGAIRQRHPALLSGQAGHRTARLGALDATLIRPRPLSALVIGATGINVLRVVTAFERRRITTLRSDDIASACERIAEAMPHVVLVLVPFASEVEHDALADRALAVGALLVQLDPNADEGTFQEALEETVQSALQHKLVREAAEVQARTAGVTDVLPAEDLDDGWDE